MFTYQYLTSIVLVISSCVCKKLTIPAFNARVAGNHKIMPLTSATDGKAVLVTSDQPLSLNFCIRRKSIIRLQNLRFSNFNQSSFFNVSFNQEKWLGTYFAPPDDDWNHFRNTGIFPKRHEMMPGWHVLKIYSMDHFLSSSQGIAVDKIEFDINDPWMDNDILRCKTICIPDGNFPPKQPTLVHTSGGARIEQKSFPTKCAEVDNIDIPLYNPRIEEFMISASLPQYNSFSNKRKENLTNCPHLSSELWNFRSFILNPLSTKIMYDKAAELSFYSKQSSSVMMIVRFSAEGQSKGSIDAKIGSLLTLRFTSLPSAISVKMRYRGKWGNMSLPQTEIFTPDQLKFTWKIPDFTWTDNGANYVILTVESEKDDLLQIDSLRLEKRAFVPEKHVTIYKSDDVHIVAVYVEMWWLAPDSMSIRLTNGQEFPGVAYLQLYRPIPWNNGYSQVFVLYQDGNTRLIPVTPDGLDWIPFGSSVILGQPYTDSVRPYTSIKQVDIDPERWQMRILYKDGGSLFLRLNSTYSETRAYVSNIVFMRDSFTLPFATLRSMYVAEGNTDVDSVKVNDTKSYHIMDQWGTVSGQSFAFYRRCISEHLTLSPDIQIDILKTKEIPQLFNEKTLRDV